MNDQPRPSRRLTLLPTPREFAYSGDDFTPADGRLILLDGPDPQALRSAAARVQSAVSECSRGSISWETVAGRAAPAEQVALALRVAPERISQAQGYELTIAPAAITVEAHDAAGAFYGACTLGQILQQAWPELPCLHASDWPDFAARGVLLDISRDKVPTLETVEALVDLLAGWKINQFQLYTEHTFAYRRHPEVWASASPFTGEEILALDAFCRERHVELVPNQNSFGHMHRWLRHARYRPLAETPEGMPGAWWGEGPFGLCPIDPGSLDLLRGLYDELLPHFSSRLFNVGCDETFDLGEGRSHEACAARGAGRVYLDFLLAIYAEVKARGRTMQFWGDIVLQHPEVIPDLPRDLIALAWGYEADHPFDAQGAGFADAGVPFYVCPGTSSWNSLAGRTDNAVTALRCAAAAGLAHGAAGYLNTDWGDNGHWQVLPVSYLGFAAGAAYAWALEANRDLDIARALDLHAFRDAGGGMGRAAYDLGNVYRAVGLEPPNSSTLFWCLQWPWDQVRTYRDALSPEALEATWAAIDAAARPLALARPARPDAELLQREFDNTVRLLRLACRRGWLALEPVAARAVEFGLDLQAFLEDYRAVWLARNRPGGLADSVRRFEAAR